MRTVITDIKSTHPAAAYFTANTSGTKCVRNMANFLIRNTYTGLRKFPEERTNNETEALHLVFTGIQMANSKTKERFKELVHQINLFIHLGYHGMDLYQLIKLTQKIKILPYPTMEHWFLSYGQLDAIMKNHKIPCYRKCVSHVAQNAIKKTVQSWKSYFERLDKWKTGHQAGEERPGIPGYIRGSESTAQYTNQVAKPLIKGNMFALNLSNYGTVDICPRDLIKGKFIKLEVKPGNGGYRLLVTYEDNFKEPVLPNNPTRIAGIDMGMTNFAAVATNTGLTPFVVDGLWLKSMNQWYNKERARLISAVTSGSDSTHSVKNSKRLDSLSRKRDNVIRDFFYKTAHHIFRELKADKIEVIVIGHNEGQKQEIDMGHCNNQSFVAIPFTRFIEIMKFLGWEYGIPVVVREESYTSRASCLDMDEIPTYKEGDNTVYTFSGKRVIRGLYKTKDGRAMNADINGAANILRKEYADAFKGVDMGYLCATTIKISAYEILGIKKKPNYKSRNKLQNTKSPAAKVKHRIRKGAQYQLDTVFGAKRKTRWESAKDQGIAKAA